MTTSSASDVNKSSQNLIPESRTKLARRHLENDGTPALVAYEAAKVLLGPEMDSWETESVARELEHTHGLNLHDITLNKIWCVMALHQNQDVFTNAHVFQKIVLALNGEMPNPQIDEKVEGEQMAWAVVLLKLELRKDDLFFDYEPLRYMAMILHDEGFVVPPRALGFTRDLLSSFNKNPDLAKEVQESMDKKTAPASSAGKAQLSKQQRVEDYVHIMYEELESGLKSYRKS